MLGIIFAMILAMLKNCLAASRFHMVFLTLLSIALVLSWSLPGIAATWQWQSKGNNERIIISLDEAQNSFQAKRSGLHSILLPFSSNEPLILDGKSPEAGKLAIGVSMGNQGITLQLQNSAFGYMVQQPSPRQIIVDIFPDPLGARWQADGKLAPVGTAPKPVQENALPEINAAPAQIAPAILPAVNPVVKSENLDKRELINNSPASQDVEMNNKAMQVPSMPPEGNNTRFVKEISPTAKNTELPLQDANGTLRADNGASKLDVDAIVKAAEVAILEGAEPILVAAANPNEVSVPPVTGQVIEIPTNQSQQENAQEDVSPATDSARGRVVGAQEVVGSINTLGPEYWPESEGLSTSLAIRPEPTTQKADTQTTKEASEEQTTTKTSVSAPIAKPLSEQGAVQTDVNTSEDASQNTADNTSANMRQSVNTEGKPPVDPAEVEVEEPRPVVYMDEEGNVVEKPPVPEELFAKAEELMFASKYAEAVPILEKLRSIPNLTTLMREQVLYNLSDSLFEVYEGKPLEGFEPISNATSEAMNVNLRSSRVPDALYRLGLVNLGVGNFAEAEGYFKALKRRFPYDGNIPTAFYQLGEGLYKKGLYAEAEKNFRVIVQEYPDASSLDEATTSLVKSLTRLKNYQEAKVFADFAEMRWARYYVENPSYVNYLAEIAYNLGNKEEAMRRYWLLYNLEPTHPRSADVLANIGDLYFETGRPKAALEVFGEIEARFPDSDAAALAYLRRSEKGIYDAPINIAEMFAVFENPGTPLPQVVYKTLQKNRPDDKRSITAGLKYAMWQLWNKEYTDAMGSAADFIDLYPENVDVELAKDIIMRGFMADLKNSLAEENFGRVLILWNGFPLVRERYGPIDPEMRNALGRGYIERGEDEKAMEMLAEFLKTPMDPRYSEATFALYFNKYLESGNWNGMLDLGELVKDWTMPQAMRGQLDYALALSAENLGLHDRALSLWKELAENDIIQLYQRAYATYFLAKDAEQRQDIRQAYSYNVKTLELFQTLQQERSDRADAERVKEAIGALMDITEVSNRIPEALEWVEKYSEFVPENSPEYPGLRFREARLYRKLGNDERARLLLEIIVNNYANSPFAAAASTELSTFEMSRDLKNFMPSGAGAQQGS